MNDRVLAFESPREHYESEAFILWCFDWRFDGLLDEFKKRFENPDYIKWAGGAKGLAEESADRTQILHQIGLSKKLHHIKKVILMVHADCGAYGAYTDPEAEIAHHTAELGKAVDIIKADPELKDLEIECYFADFHSLSRIAS